MDKSVLALKSWEARVAGPMDLTDAKRGLFEDCIILTFILLELLQYDMCDHNTNSEFISISTLFLG